MSSEPRGTVAFSLTRIASQSRAARTSPRERIPTKARVERSGSRSTISCAMREIPRRTSSAPSSTVSPDSFPASRDRSLKGSLGKVYSLEALADADDGDLALEALVVDDERVVPRQGIARHIDHEVATSVERARRSLRAAGAGIAEAHEER